jgi:hypothetical protein
MTVYRRQREQPHIFSPCDKSARSLERPDAPMERRAALLPVNDQANSITATTTIIAAMKITASASDMSHIAHRRNCVLIRNKVENEVGGLRLNWAVTRSAQELTLPVGPAQR